MLLAHIAKMAISEGTKKVLFFAGGTAAGVGAYAGGKKIVETVKQKKAEKEASAENTPASEA
jgi:phosphate/sulfate permease